MPKKLNKIPSARERLKKGYQIKVSIAKGFVKVCDTINIANSKLYKKAHRIKELDEQIDLGLSTTRVDVNGPYGAVIKCDDLYNPKDEDDEMTAIQEDFKKILSKELDRLLEKP